MSHGSWILGDTSAPHVSTPREMVSGVGLRTYAQGVTWRALRGVVVGVVEALAFLHGQGIRHGDVTPSNILVDANGHAVLVDLSCASELDASVDALRGVPGFVAPEVLDGCADQRSDLFSLGRTLERARPQGGYPTYVRRLVTRLVESDPRRRPQSAEEVLQALRIRTLPADHEVYPRLPRLLGRRVILDQLTDAITAGLVGRAPRTILLRGHEGIGMTRVLSEVRLAIATGRRRSRGCAPTIGFLLSGG